MDNKKIHIDDLYREELGNQIETPPAAVWESLSGRLDNKQPKAGPSFGWMWWIGSAIVVLSLLYFTGKSLININGHATTTPAQQENNYAATNTTPTTKQEPITKEAAAPSSTIETPAEETVTTPNTNTTEKTDITEASATTANAAKATAKAITASSNPTASETASNKPQAESRKARAKQEQTTTPAAALVKNTARKQRKQNTTPIATQDVSTTQPEVITVTTTQSTPTATASAPVAQRKLHAPRVDTNTRVVAASAEANISHLININLAQAKKNNYITSSAATASTTKQTNNKGTATETKVYAAAPVNTYTAPAPAKKLEAPRTEAMVNAEKPQASTAVPNAEAPLLASAPVEATAPAQVATASKNDVAATPAITNPDVEKLRKVLPYTFNYGAKLGYEFAKGDYHVNSYVLSPYLQFNLTSRLSLALQPGIKYSTLNNTYLDPAKSYYNITSAQLDSNHQRIQTSIDTAYNPIYGAVKPKYYYTQSHDSIVTSTAIAQKTYFEFELPVLVQYEIIRHVRVYGGVSANFSKIVQVTEHREEYKNITLKDSVILRPQASADPVPTIPSPYNKFAYNYPPYNQYYGTSGENPTSSPVRFSYMLGFNYQVWRRFSLDFMMQGSLNKHNYIYDTRVRSIYQQTHFRISLGYQFGK